MVEGTAIGQWTPGVLSNADTRTTTTSTAEHLFFTSSVNVQPYIGMSSLFTEKALATGVLVPSTTGGFRSVTGQYYSLNPRAEELVSQGTTSPTPTSNTAPGFNLLPVLLVGGLLLIGGVKI